MPLPDHKWTIAYRTRTNAGHFHRVDVELTWSQSVDLGSYLTGVLDTAVWTVPTAEAERTGYTTAEDIANILMPSGKRIPIKDDGTLPFDVWSPAEAECESLAKDKAHRVTIEVLTGAFMSQTMPLPEDMPLVLPGMVQISPEWTRLQATPQGLTWLKSMVPTTYARLRETLHWSANEEDRTRRGVYVCTECETEVPNEGQARHCLIFHGDDEITVRMTPYATLGDDAWRAEHSTVVTCHSQYEHREMRFSAHLLGPANSDGPGGFLSPLPSVIQSAAYGTMGQPDTVIQARPGDILRLVCADVTYLARITDDDRYRHPKLVVVGTDRCVADIDRARTLANVEESLRWARSANGPLDADFLAEAAKEATTRPDDFGYFGDRDLFGTWGLTIGKTRDSDLTTQANYAAILDDIRDAAELDGDPDDFVDVLSSSNWAFGWSDQIMVRVWADDNSFTHAFLMACYAARALEDDAVYDDQRHSDFMSEAEEAAWDGWLSHVARDAVRDALMAQGNLSYLGSDPGEWWRRACYLTDTRDNDTLLRDAFYSSAAEPWFSENGNDVTVDNFEDVIEWIVANVFLPPEVDSKDNALPQPIPDAGQLVLIGHPNTDDRCSACGRPTWHHA